MSQVLLKGQVRLLRIGVNKTLALGIAEGLEGHREKMSPGSDNSG